MNEDEQDRLYPPRLGGSDEPTFGVHRATAPGSNITLWTFRDCVAARAELMAEEASWKFTALDRMEFAASLLREHVGRVAVKAVLLAMLGGEEADECDEYEAEVAVREAEAKIAGRGFDCGSCGEDDDE